MKTLSQCSPLKVLYRCWRKSIPGALEVWNNKAKTHRETELGSICVRQSLYTWIYQSLWYFQNMFYRTILVLFSFSAWPEIFGRYAVVFRFDERRKGSILENKLSNFEHISVSRYVWIWYGSLQVFIKSNELYNDVVLDFEKDPVKIEQTSAAYTMYRFPFNILGRGEKIFIATYPKLALARNCCTSRHWITHISLVRLWDSLFGNSENLFATSDKFYSFLILPIVSNIRVPLHCAAKRG